jgi:hypothetical protein
MTSDGIERRCMELMLDAQSRYQEMDRAGDKNIGLTI